MSIRHGDPPKGKIEKGKDQMGAARGAFYDIKGGQQEAKPCRVLESQDSLQRLWCSLAGARWPRLSLRSKPTTSPRGTLNLSTGESPSVCLLRKADWKRSRWRSGRRRPR